MNSVLIIGLGNPGLRYRETRHNIGFVLIDEVAKQLEVKFKKRKDLQAEVAELNLDGQKVVLAKPLTYMNKSGEAAHLILDKYDLSDLYVLYDDASMEFGKTRIRQEGSAGGHNGVKSIITHFGSDKFKRFKFGVGEPPEKIALEDWVLGKFSKDEIKEIEKKKAKIAKQIIES